jgi:acyl-CoA synthetase (NDP forming)
MVYKELEGAGIPVFNELRRGLTALANVTKSGLYLQNPEKRSSEGLDMARFTMPELPLEDFRTLNEYKAKQLLAKVGFNSPKGYLVTTPEEVADATRRLNFPLVMKLQSHLLLHKSDNGLVKLNIQNENEAANSFYELIKKGVSLVSREQVQGVLVEEMVRAGIEVIVGARTDQVFGSTVMFGLGGIYVELFKDVSFRVAPVTVDEALNMVNDVAASAILEGFRGGPRYDVEGLADVIVRVSALIYKYHDQLREIEINPLMVLPKGQGVVVLDALVVGDQLR